MSDAVMVAVRCRPFNKRELALGSKCIVTMNGAKTTLLDPTGAVAPKDFTFDYSYWSFDASSPNFATNPKVYSDLGVNVLNNAWSGYNCCLFAYGQTGSGKSFSMVGYGEDKGIVPLAMEEMFARIGRNRDPNVKYMVEASMMEIYNEKVRDLFNPDPNAGGANGLKVRDNPQTGPYVEDLSRSVLTSYKEFEHLLSEGNAVRTVAATQMNATSSRAHTVFQIVFTKTTHDEETNKSSAMTSKINLVDLAGSERLAKTGASGQQMKEGIGINKSLTALGNCIEKLAKKANQKKGAKDTVHVPYRDSVLTWLLKESLGGNAKTIMIAAVSPSDDNYDESLSTLRYADRAKQIKNQAHVNEDENGRLIRELKKEIQALREALAKGGAPAAGPAGTSGMSDQEKAEYLALKEQMKQNEDLVARMNMSWEEKMKETEELAFRRAQALNANTKEVEEKKKRLPHLVNLHKDALMSECLSYFFPPGRIRLCTKAIDPPPTEDDIILSGLQIRPDHAVADYDPATLSVWLTPGEGARVFVNGKLIKERTLLQHNDRLILGAHLVFRLIFPNHASDDADSIFDWEYANKELTTSTIEALNKPDEETLRAQAEQAEKLTRMQEEIESERLRAKAQQEAREAEYERTLREIAKKKEDEIAATKLAIEQASHADSQKLSRKLAEREAELERERALAAKQHSERLEAMKKEQEALEAKLEAQEAETRALHKKHQVEKRDRQLLEETLMGVIPMVNEANAICTELGQSLRFSIKLEAKRSLDNDGFTEHTDVWIRVLNLEDELEVMWDMQTLSEALFLMRDIYNNFQRSGEVDIPRGEGENPFHLTPTGPMMIGTARLYLQPCYFLLPIHESTAIIDYKGEHKGQLYVNLIPIPPRDEDTLHAREEDLFFEEEELVELKGEPLSLRLEIKKCMGLPAKFATGVFVSYKFFFDTVESRTAPPAAGETATINPLLNYERTLLVDCIEDEFIEYVKTGVLEFNVYGTQQVQDKPGEGGKGKEEEEEEEEEGEDDDGDQQVDADGNPIPRSKSAKRGGKKSSGGSGSFGAGGDSAATGSGSNGYSARLAQLEAVLKDIHTHVEPSIASDETAKIITESPEAISTKVAELKAELESLRSRSPAPAAGGDSAEAAALRAELEALRVASPAAAAAASAAAAEENASLKAALESLKSKAPPDAAEMAEWQQKAASSEAAVAALKASLAQAEEKAKALRQLQAQEAALNKELTEKLVAAASAGAGAGGSAATPAGAHNDEHIAALRKELESARFKVAQATPNERHQAEIEELKRQLAEEQAKKKSSACTIL